MQKRKALRERAEKIAYRNFFRQQACRMQKAVQKWGTT